MEEKNGQKPEHYTCIHNDSATAIRLSLTLLDLLRAAGTEVEYSKRGMVYGPDLVWVPGLGFTVYEDGQLYRLEFGLVDVRQVGGAGKCGCSKPGDGRTWRHVRRSDEATDG